jgi:hypothetical protein
MPKKTHPKNSPQGNFVTYYKQAFVHFPLNQHKSPVRGITHSPR